MLHPGCALSTRLVVVLVLVLVVLVGTPQEVTTHRQEGMGWLQAASPTR